MGHRKRTMPTAYPLTFDPIFKERVWGGRRLFTGLGKAPPSDSPSTPIGESWELVDLPTAQDQSRVTTGAWAGRSLGELVRSEHRAELMGPVALDGGHFPLLVKYIDASQTLSVQVHPGEEAAARLGGRAKAEAWYILAAEPGATIYLGLQPGTTAAQLRAALERGAVEELVLRVPARPGDLLPVPPGTVHAIGAGVLLAEVQQPSDTTYRVYDWGRVGLDGRPRELHVAQALESIDFRAAGGPTTGPVEMGRFRVDVLEGPRELAGEGPAVLVGLAGRLEVNHPDGVVPCGLGDVVLVPHACRPEVRLTGEPGRALWVTFARGAG
jgi:mannose-6-phosphate isomerase